MLLKRSGVIPIAILLLVLACGVAQLLPGCAKMEQDDMTLSSGVDKKVGSVDSEGGGQANAQYDADYRQQPAAEQSGGRAASPSDGTAAAQNVGVEGTRGRSLVDLPDVRRWLSPAAYAAERGVDEQFLVRSGRLELKVESVNDTLDKITAIAKANSGTLTDSSIQKSELGYHTGYLTVRVPAERFFDTWDALRKIGECLTQETQCQDVGQEYVSAVSRMHTLLAEQQTLEQMLEEALAVQRARGLGEGYSILLDTQRRLSEVTAEIRGIEDRVASLADQITRSTIRVELSENPQLPVPPQDKFSWGLIQVFNQSVRDLLVVLRGLAQFAIHFAVTAWVWLIPLLLFGRWGWRYYKRVLAQAPPAPKPVTPPPAA